MKIVFPWDFFFVVVSMKQLRVNKITEYLEAKKNFEKDYIGIEEQDIDDIDTNYFIAYAIFFVLF